VPRRKPESNNLSAPSGANQERIKRHVEKTTMSDDKTLLENDDLFGIDVDVEDPSFGSQYPIIQWVNGDPGKKKSGGLEYTGGFFISAEQGLDNVPGAEPYTLITANGDEVEGFAVRDLEITPVRFRRSWLAQADEKGLSQRFPWNAYEDAVEHDHQDRPRGRGQLVALVSGMEEPVVITLSGMTSAAVFSAGRDRGIIPNFSQIVINRAKQLARRAGRNIDYPLCAFKLTVGPKRDEKGEPLFDTVGSGQNTSKVTMPVWLDQPEGMADEAYIRRHFVGREMFGKTQDMHKACDEWVMQWSPKALIEQLKRSAEVSNELKGLRSGAVSDGDGLPGDREVPF
jgi:hypothetical protein